jgi:hypothetical protein
LGLQPKRLNPLLYILIFSAAFVGRSLAGQSTKEEQTEFTVGEPIQVPAQIPATAVRALSAEGTVSNCLKSKAIPLEKLPAEWFTASIIHLHRANEADLVVVPAMESGSDKSKSDCWDLVKFKGSDRYEGTLFWILRQNGRDYEVVLSKDAPQLIIGPTRSRGFQTLEVLDIGLDFIGSDYREFNGKRYVSKKYKLPK